MDKSKGIDQLSDDKSVSSEDEAAIVSEEEDADENQNDVIDSYSIDLKYLDKEFRCPRGQHIISNPVIASCCGVTLCLKCAVDANYKTQTCCFCREPIQVGSNLPPKEGYAKLLPNHAIKKLLQKQIHQNLSSLSKEEREKLMQD